ncbi:MAG: T9SS type A sorting domain-containing protein [Ignavibacteriaceae bacterium]|nr:T9SS type A sorting domain-containing protein [Ignavibacteriaceae bacterium]
MKKLIILSFFLSISAFPQNHMQSFINRVNSLVSLDDKNTVVDSFINFVSPFGFPYIENNEANFIYRGSVTSASVSGDFNSWGLTGMNNLSGTNFFYNTRVFEANARIDYKFVTNGSNWILDPRNPNTCTGGFGPNSELAMPGYVQPWEINSYPSIPKGQIETRSIHSNNVNANYAVKVYLPPGYNSSRQYPSVYFHDGYEYIDLAKAANVLDNLIDSNLIEPVIGVFVKPNNRNEEYAGTKRNSYRLFFVNELVPYIDSIYSTKKDASQRLVLGDSYGGNISALISYNHPEVFGNCGLHSAAFQPNGYEAYGLIVNGPVKNIKWVSVWGTYEGLFLNLRLFTDSMSAKGYNYKWVELPEGHSWGLWRANIDFIITHIFPPVPSGVSDDESSTLPEENYLEQNYPNPFNSSTVINFSVSKEVFTTIKLFDVAGQEKQTLVNNFIPAGRHSLKLDLKNYASGVYLIRMTAENFLSTKKIVLLR